MLRFWTIHLGTWGCFEGRFESVFFFLHTGLIITHHTNSNPISWGCWADISMYNSDLYLKAVTSDSETAQQPVGWLLTVCLSKRGIKHMWTKDALNQWSSNAPKLFVGKIGAACPSIASAHLLEASQLVYVLCSLVWNRLFGRRLWRSSLKAILFAWSRVVRVSGGKTFPRKLVRNSCFFLV